MEASKTDAIKAAEDEYRQALALLRVVRAVEKDAARMLQISVERLGNAWRERMSE